MLAADVSITVRVVRSVSESGRIIVLLLYSLALNTMAFSGDTYHSTNSTNVTRNAYFTSSPENTSQQLCIAVTSTSNSAGPRPRPQGWNSL
ncbi:hypothetical protein EDD18DRAFT_1205645 [Armillaria luteobubalina]|uniref:Uncharacterized protein n=1 Tax=Armillaria luteobubalina TaxID=153913 RepID=A0AA39PAF4_9AGAR|nr:hypothetical protein EDD18DRAFT_1205645 [Armillaria luteobubalina]